MSRKRDQIFAASELLLIILSGAALTGSAIMIDIMAMFYEAHPNFRSNTKKLLDSLGGSFTSKTISLTLGILEKRNLVERTRGGFRITNKGEDFIQPKMPDRMLGKWDGRWRMIVFDIEENNRIIRNLIRANLKALGCGMMQFSVWVSPYDIIKDLNMLRANYNLGNRLRWFICDSVDDEDDLVHRCWPLNNLTFEYEKLYKKGRELSKEKKMDNFIEFKAWEKKFTKVLSMDPLLPAHLLPKDWKGTEVARLHLILKSNFSNTRPYNGS